MKTAVIMSRVNSDEQALGYSLGIQEEALTRYCEKNNIKIFHNFKEDYSAKNFNRPDLPIFLPMPKSIKEKLTISWSLHGIDSQEILLMLLL